MRTRTMRLVLAAAIGIGLAACGGDGPTSASADSMPMRASIVVSVLPSPVIAQPSATGLCGIFDEWAAQFDVEIRETAGLGVNVDFIDVTTEGGLGSLNFGANDIIRQAGTNRIGPRGRLTVPMGLRYCVLRERQFNVLVQCTDDRGNRVTGTAVLTVR